MKRYYYLLGVLCLGISTVANAQQKPPDAPAKLISAAKFIMSAEEEETGVTGTMKIAADINKTGDVIRAVVYVAPDWPCLLDFDAMVSPILHRAEQIVKTFKFSPATKGGKPAESRVSISMTIGKAARKKNTEETNDIKNGEAALVAAGDGKIAASGVVNGKAISLPQPAYPQAAREARVSGTVVVQVVIDENGMVRSAQAVSGPTLLQLAARNAACGARFAPTTLSGRPVKVSGVVTYNFSIDR